ncbi:39S ribosomal protein L24, mitochondrial [Strongyloides ratti]|uniref:Large ribosomal subunit protein uL24m n=1 Tax=Strongyloides ratti TaxID=34506 RepID=A0A090MZ19_STRRB|nr:39S ribosomal protein L24, mitochondrial [Strongyloides ratti]CEF68164.1 39S ribosomal protein L24, mitochondrial [Strongyloides ratti]
MFKSSVLRCVKKPSSTLDYSKHIPKGYVERLKRTVPKKVYSNRLGAPDIIRWELPPEDYVPELERPWEQKALKKNMQRAYDYHRSLLDTKFFKLRKPSYNKPLPDDEWFIFKGDYVMVMVGKDKFRKGKVAKVNRETNTVIVDGLHTKFEDFSEGFEKYGVRPMKRWAEQPLDVSKGEIKLVNPYDEGPTDAEWKLNADGTGYIRLSKSTGHEIPLPTEAFMTYEYITQEKYLESKKDTNASDVLKRTYVPKLCSFEDEIMESLGIKEEKQRKPSFWY